MSVTIYDVAKLAKVSPSWVSWALRDHPRAQEIRQETRDRIFRAAREIGYRPKASAATVRTGINTSTVAIIWHGQGTAAGQFHLISRLNSFGYGVRIYYDCDLEGAFDDILVQQIKYFFCSSGDQKIREAVGAFGKKHDLCGVFTSNGNDIGYPVFTTDENRMFCQMVHDLYDLGHRKIAMYCAEHKLDLTTRRHNSYLLGLAECGLPVNEELMICGEFDAERLLRFVEEKQPTAICCIDGSIALATENCLIRNGIRIPQDISIYTTCGNAGEVLSGIVPITFYSDPGEVLVNDALDHLFGKGKDFTFDEHNQRLYQPKFHAGESIAPPRKAKRVVIQKNPFFTDGGAE